ncbi:VTC domain-containing protein [bacterium]|nr:VTC domain-containing protein [bacterium]
MNTRFREYTEDKFFVPIKALGDLRAILSPCTSSDSNGIAGSYQCRSVYFDSPKLNFFYDKIEGEEKKLKLRIRCYKNDPRNEWENYFLEAKCKVLGKVQKWRIPLELGEVEKIFKTGFSMKIWEKLFSKNVSEWVARSFVKNFLRPVVTILYNRTAMTFTGIPGFRLTFDREISAFPPTFLKPPSGNFEQIQGLLPLPIIFELKSNVAVPVSLLQKMQKLNCKQVSVSKFAFGLEQLMERQFDFRSSLLPKHSFISEL